MKIIITAKGDSLNSSVDPRFGRSEFFVVYDRETESIEAIDNRAVENEAHGAGPMTAQKIAELEAEIVITGNGPGKNAASVLKAAGIKVYAGAGGMTVREALEAYTNGDLAEFQLA